MPQNLQADYFVKLRKVQAELSQLRNLGSSANFKVLLKDIESANKMADTLGIKQPYPDSLVSEIEAMQDRLTRYQQTGLDIPNLSNVVKH